MQIGIDLGGTKTEVIVLNESNDIFRYRVPSVRNSYEGTIKTIRDLIMLAEDTVKERCSIGVAMPGTISPFTGLVKNANSTWLNGHPLDKDLSIAIGRKVRVANDANCFAMSEASDGVGTNSNVVFAFILGTGSGSGIVVNKKIITGAMGNAGEYGHTPLAWQTEYEFNNAPKCYCGQKGCYELWISGTGFEDDYKRLSCINNLNDRTSGQEIIKLAIKGDKLATKILENYKSRLGRAIAMITNILDPDIFVLGGGMSNINLIYSNIDDYVRPYIFGKEFQTPISKAMYGDSSGVRGAAWLWPVSELDEALIPYK